MKGTWTGYKVQLTETCDDDTPHLLMDRQTTVATTQDVELTAPVQEALVAKEVPPRIHIVDEGYIEAALLVTRDRRGRPPARRHELAGAHTRRLRCGAVRGRLGRGARDVPHRGHERHMAADAGD